MYILVYMCIQIDGRSFQWLPLHCIVSFTFYNVCCTCRPTDKLVLVVYVPQQATVMYMWLRSPPRPQVQKPWNTLQKLPFLWSIVFGDCESVSCVPFSLFGTNRSNPNTSSLLCRYVMLPSVPMIIGTKKHF